MTSPSIKANEKHHKGVLRSMNGSSGADDRSQSSQQQSLSTSNSIAAAQNVFYGMFRWLRIFRFSDLMIQQGC